MYCFYKKSQSITAILIYAVLKVLFINSCEKLKLMFLKHNRIVNRKRGGDFVEKKYYEAYENRYRQVHEKKLSWFSSEASQIVMDTIKKYYSGKNPKILDVGCGEGRDIFPLLDEDYDVTGIDISCEAVNFCKNKAKEKDRRRFKVVDVCTQNMAESFDFIYSVATLHMLLRDEDRKNYLSFIFTHLVQDGYGLILTMGDGIEEMQSNADYAFENVKRTHEETGIELEIAATSCRKVNFQTFEKELKDAGFKIIDKGITRSGRDFPMIMYAVVNK